MAHARLACRIFDSAHLQDRHLLALAFLAGVTAGCSAAAPTPSTPASAPAEAQKVSFEEGAWAPFHSKRFELSLRLPDGAAWRIDDHRTPFLRATHEATQSKIALRSWREDGNVTRSGCYARARGWDASLPDLDAARLVDDGTRPLFDRLSARVAVGLVGSAENAPTKGFVVAIVGDIRRCLLLAYETEARGPAAENDIAERLAIVADRLLPTLKLDQSFAPSRDPAMPSPPGGAGGVR